MKVLRPAIATLAALLIVGLTPALAGATPTSGSASLATVSAAVDGGDELLSENGSAAIADLRTCLASSDVLNVYYLIDNSGSLAAGDGDPGTDPDKLRAPILANSLDQLGALGGEATVNWGAGFFSTGFSSAIPFRPWTEGSPDDLSSAIEDAEPRGYTNWPAALAGAQHELADQQAAQPGCQVLIWLTDGQLDTAAPAGPGQEDYDAINELCGSTLDDRGDPASDAGIFNAFRQSGIVVIGALLAVDETTKTTASPVMQTLVEGSAPGTETTCGVQPIPDTYVHGAFVEASDAQGLAQVFARLGAEVGGGYPQPFNADGSFWIDPGVARMRIVTGADWTLTPPAGSGWDPASTAAEQPWATVSTGNGVTIIDVDTRAPDADGSWVFDTTDARALYLFSDLTIQFDAKNSIELSADGSASATLGAQVVDAGGDAASLDVYGVAEFRASYLDPAGAQVDLPGAAVDPATGDITIPIPEDFPSAQLTVTATIDPLQTDAHQLALAPVSSRQTVATVLPAEFPRAVALPVQLDPLEGSDGEAVGTLKVSGPESGGDGTVCLPTDPTIISDAGERGGDWKWDVTSDLDSERCVTVPQGGEVSITLAASNPIAADSAVQASLPVEFRSAAGDSVTQQVPVAFTSTRPINTVAVAGLALLLLLLGILVPMIVLWFVNRWTTKLDVGSGTQRASFPIVFTADRVSIPASAKSDSELSNSFIYQSPRGGVRSLRDADLGEIRARVSWFPIAEPWYEIAPSGAARILMARAGRTSTGAEDASGRMRFSSLPLDRFWAVVVTDSELAKFARGTEARGTAVVYHRASPGEAGQYSRRLSEIATEPKLLERVRRAAGALKDAGGDRAQVGGTTSSAPQRPPASASVPPRPGGSSGAGAPPRTTGMPPRPGGIPPRPADPPPPSGRPRPGTPPPPRR